MPEYIYGSSPRLEMQRLIPRWIESLLDVGCGNGSFGASLKSERPGLVVWGLDTASEVQLRATAALDTFLLGTFPGDAPDRRFDCLTFNDSLEHMIDPWHALEAAKTMLTERGVIVVSLPNIRQYSIIKMLVFKGQWEYREQGIMDRTHLRFFTRRSAISMFEQCGLEVVSCTPLAVANRGRKARTLARLGNKGIEFRARQFAFIVRQRLI